MPKGVKEGVNLRKLPWRWCRPCMGLFLQLYSTAHSLTHFFWSQVTCSKWLLQCWLLSKRWSKYHDNSFLYPLRNRAECLFIARHKKHVFVRSWVILGGSDSWSWVALSQSGASSRQSYSLHTLHVTAAFIKVFTEMLKNNTHFHR